MRTFYFFLIFIHVLQAASITWQGTSSSMSSDSNWSNGNALGIDPLSDDVIFTTNGTQRQINVDLDNTGGSIFEANTISFIGDEVYTLNLGGNAVATHSGLTVNSSSGITQTIRASFFIDNDQTWNVQNLGSTLLLGNPFTFSTSAVLSLTGAGAYRFEGGLVESGGVGELNVQGTGVATLMGVGDYTGSTTVYSGATLNIQNNRSLGSILGGTEVQSGGTLEIQNNIQVGNESLMLNGQGLGNGGALKNVSGVNGWTGNVTLSSNSTINVVAGKLTLSGVLSGGSGLTKAGSGALVLSGVNTYTGPTRVSGGTLFVNGSLQSASMVTVDAGAILGGDGTIQGSVSNSGGISPGNGDKDIGTLTTGDEVWSGSPEFIFEINNALGTMGDGWDLLNISGSLDLTAVNAGGISVDLWTLNGASDGLMSNFNANQNYLWTFVSTSSGITGFNASLFQIDLTHFQNSYTGQFQVLKNGNDLAIQYSAVPEPRVYFLVFAGFILFSCFWRRKEKLKYSLVPHREWNAERNFGILRKNSNYYN